MADRTSADAVRSELRQALGAAMKTRDAIAVAAFRSALAAIDNAEAADTSDAPVIQPGAIAGGVAGLGAGEVPRRLVSEEQATEIVLGQIAKWQAAGAGYEGSGRQDYAARLHAEAAILTEFLLARSGLPNLIFSAARVPSRTRTDCLIRRHRTSRRAAVMSSASSLRGRTAATPDRSAIRSPGLSRSGLM
jgi:uncharacterized protein YqeY